MRPSAPEHIYDRLVTDRKTGCLLWTGSTCFGYGHVRIQGVLRYVHVVAWELEKGPVPEGMELDHVFERGCRYRRCALVAHMEPVTRRENVMRKLAVLAEQQDGKSQWQLERQRVNARRKEYMRALRLSKAAAQAEAAG